MCLCTGGSTLTKLTIIRVMVTCRKVSRGSRNNFSNQDWGGVRDLWGIEAAVQFNACHYKLLQMFASSNDVSFGNRDAIV